MKGEFNMQKIKRKIVFLILHYMTIDDTIKCIESIRDNVLKGQYSIVVVDNFSPNNSGVLLREKYHNSDDVTILLNKENAGFARGNNIGFRYIKENFIVNYIAMINNDTCLLHSNFLSLIEEEYQKSLFAVLGPKILLPNQQINPIQKEIISVKELKSRRIRFFFNYLFNLLYIAPLYEGLKRIFLNISGKKIHSSYSDCGVLERQEDIVLHGAFLIFSEQYFSLFDGLDPRTYMFMEEKLLAVRLRKHHLKAVYNPKLEIYHNEDSATNSVKKNIRSKNLFIYKNALHSSKILMKELVSSDE